MINKKGLIMAVSLEDINETNNKILDVLEDLGLIAQDYDLRGITKLELIISVNELPVVRVEHKQLNLKEE